MRPTPAVISVAFAAALTLITVTTQAQSRTPLKNLAPDQIVQSIEYCRGEYRVTTATGERRRFPELNLRFKTDASSYGPERGQAVLLPAGMQGDRGQIIFSGPDELKRMVVERCEGGAR